MKTKLFKLGKAKNQEVNTWKRDYVALLKQFVSYDMIHVTKITEEVGPLIKTGKKLEQLLKSLWNKLS